MSTIAYRDLLTQLRAQIWPEGEAENLVGPHDTLFAEAFADLQYSIKVLQQNNCSIIPYCDTYFECAKTICSAPFGEINYVRTLANGNWCDPVYYDWRGFEEVNTWAFNTLTPFSKSNSRGYKQPDNTGLATLPQGIKFAQKNSDSIYGRARIGVFALHSKRLYLAPWIQSTEVIVVDWDGIKKEWLDTDVLDQTYWDLEVMKVVQAYVSWRHEVKWGRDAQEKAAKERDYKNEFADIVLKLESNTRQRDLGTMRRRLPIRSELDNDVLVPVDVTVVLMQTAESGSADANEQAVATLVAQNAPDLLIHAGNVTAANRPYASVVEAYYPKATFFACPGAFDWALNALVDYQAYFAYPNNGRYYEKVHGQIHFFFLDGDAAEPDGNTSASIQAEWFAAKVALSPAKWKVAVINPSPYSSGSTYGSTVGLQDWVKGVDLVISAKERNYEHLLVAGQHYVVNGLGGNGVTGFGAPVAGSIIRYNAKYGALQLTATCTSLEWKFINTDLTVIEDYKLTK